MFSVSFSLSLSPPLVLLYKFKLLSHNSRSSPPLLVTLLVLHVSMINLTLDIYIYIYIYVFIYTVLSYICSFIYSILCLWVNVLILFKYILYKPIRLVIQNTLTLPSPSQAAPLPLLPPANYRPLSSPAPLVHPSPLYYP